MNSIEERLDLNRIIKNRYFPRWIIFLLDIFVVISAFFISYSLRYNIASTHLNTVNEFRQLFPVVVVYGFFFLVFRPFAGTIRHTTTHDIQKILESVLSSSVVLTGITLLSRKFYPAVTLNVPLSVIILQLMVTSTIMVFSRLVIKYIYNFLTRSRQDVISIMIYGAGDLGQATRLALERSVTPAYRVRGFIDNNKSMQGKERSGVRIYSPAAAMKNIISDLSIREIVIAINPNNILGGASNELFSYCLENRITLRKIPPLNEWLDGGFEVHQISKIAIDDLLSREEIRLDITRIQGGLAGKTILVTGAAGSIGSEIVRQLIEFKTGKIVLLDQAESALYDLQMELRHRYNGSRDYKIVIGDISDQGRMESVFSRYKPDIVFNAAAYKHVPLLEENVSEAVRVNIGGTKVLADLAVNYGIEKFIMISSDKAVNPTSVMGATKRICELYIQSLTLSPGVKTQFITTRFGNVLGSNGSVVPLFSRQIESGGPITLTHKEMKRYFMTIPEACQLVLEAGFMGKGGEIFVFDMGEPVLIYDLAVKMISLAGLVPEKDIKIVETGMRPGEKLFEEILTSDEKNIPTYNSKILIANMVECEPGEVRRIVDELISSAGSETDSTIVEKIKLAVPEFTPQNSLYL